MENIFKLESMNLDSTNLNPNTNLNTNTSLKNTQTAYKTYEISSWKTKEEFFKDIKSTVDKMWVNTIRATDLVKKHYKAKWYQVPWIDLKTQLLFSDEEDIRDMLYNQWFKKEDINTTIENRRKSMLKNVKLDRNEWLLIKQFADAGVTTEQAVEGLKMMRDKTRIAEYEAMSPLKKAWKSFFDFTVWSLAGWVWTIWWVSNFVTWWKVWDDAMLAREKTLETGGFATKAGDFYWSSAVEWYWLKGAWKVVGATKTWA